MVSTKSIVKVVNAFRSDTNGKTSLSMFELLPKYAEVIKGNLCVMATPKHGTMGDTKLTLRVAGMNDGLYDRKLDRFMGATGEKIRPSAWKAGVTGLGDTWNEEVIRDMPSSYCDLVNNLSQRDGGGFSWILPYASTDEDRTVLCTVAVGVTGTLVGAFTTDGYRAGFARCVDNGICKDVRDDATLGFFDKRSNNPKNERHLPSIILMPLNVVRTINAMYSAMDVTVSSIVVRGIQNTFEEYTRRNKEITDEKKKMPWTVLWTAWTIKFSDGSTLDWQTKDGCIYPQVEKVIEWDRPKLEWEPDQVNAVRSAVAELVKYANPKTHLIWFDGRRIVTEDPNADRNEDGLIQRFSLPVNVPWQIGEKENECIGFNGMYLRDILDDMYDESYSIIVRAPRSAISSTTFESWNQERFTLIMPLKIIDQCDVKMGTPEEIEKARADYEKQFKDVRLEG